MAKDPAALLYIDKWKSATTEMDAITRAYYMDLILHQFDKGDLPNNIEELANICRVRFSEFKQFKHVFEHVLKQKFELNPNNRLENDFAKEIIQKRELFKKKRSIAGIMSYVIRFSIKHFKVDPDQIEYLKREIDFEHIDLKNKQVLKQVIKQKLELYINVDVDVDVNNKYKSIYNYYLSLNLKKHKTYTDAMKNSIKRFCETTKTTPEECKILLQRHVKAIEATKNKDHPVKMRAFSEFFGQKVFNGKELIAEQYMDGGKYSAINNQNKNQDDEFFTQLEESFGKKVK